jgi:uncharacterized phage protein gp47/JayE
MAFIRPALTTLVDRIEQDFISRMALVGAVLRRSVVYVLVRVLAGAVHMLHGHLEYLSRQLFYDTSEDEYLRRQAALYDVSPSAATYATGTVTLTGSDGNTVPAGAVLLRSDGAEYTTDADATIAGGTATAAVTAEEAGADGTLTVGLVLALQSPVGGVDATCEVASSVADGMDQETAAALRGRLLERLREPPHGGAENDYSIWSKEVAGVTRVWVAPLGLGVGTVVVRFVRDNDVGGIFPSAGEVAAVQAYLDNLRPVTAAVTVAAPVETPLDLTLAVVPDTVAVRAAVAAELDALLDRVAEPGGTVLLSAIRTAIGTAAGLTDYTLTAPAVDVVHGAGELPVLGTITWV